VIYTYNHTIKLKNITGVSRPSEDPKWVTDYFKQQVTLRTNDIIVDLGCGNGVITLLLAKTFPQCHIHGIDIDPSLIQMAKDNAKENNLTNCSFECINILKHLFPKKYDHVIKTPPYHRQENGFKAISSLKNIAHGATLDEMIKWIETSIQLTCKNGTTTILQHTHNIESLKHTFDEFKHKIHYIETSPNKKPKRFIVHIKK